MLYDFRNLKQLVRDEFGVDPDNVNSSFKPITEKLTHRQLLDKVAFSPEGITYTDKNGGKHKGFLYIETGYNRDTALKNGWKTIVPKFHTTNCITIENKRRALDFNGKYVFSNDIIEMEDLDGVSKELQVCSNCVSLDSRVHRYMTSSEFKKMLVDDGDYDGNFYDSDLPKNISTDFWGYTAEWDDTSKNYRIKMKFTCEECGIKLNSNMADGYYLETHHLDGNKRNNEDSNLKCLCVLCHANVDEFHVRNYAKGSQLQKLRNFIQSYEDRLKQVGNKYLQRYQNGQK